MTKKFKIDINLDDAQELLKFIRDNWTTTVEALAFQFGFDGAGSREAVVALQDYAEVKLLALRCRLNGKIADARYWESRSDAIYQDRIQPHIDCW